jgi:hypothetical protein
VIYRVLAAVLVLACAGCASGERAATSSEVANRFLASVDAGDTATACDLVAPEPRQEVCPDSLADLGLPGGTVDEVDVWGDRAQARGRTDTLFLVELDAGWRVAAAGCTLTADGTYDCLLSDS